MITVRAHNQLSNAGNIYTIGWAVQDLQTYMFPTQI